MIKELKIVDKNTIFNAEISYIIPRYQRAYAWEEKEIIQLIDDINGITRDENYYIGSLVVAKIENENERYEVVDGQQRLTTLYLILQYLRHQADLHMEIFPSLSFDCRPKSNHTLKNIKNILACIVEKQDYEDADFLEQSIFSGLKIIHQKFSEKDLDMNNFISCLKRVVLYRIQVPKNTDLNRYFEIMNTRGEQLEQHDILKARLMKPLDTKQQEFFSRVWNACSDMTGYVQMHFSPKERELIFGGGWNNEPSQYWKDYKSCLEINIDDDKSLCGIREIIKPNFKVDNSDYQPDDQRIRFDSIIDFPFFLLHSIRTFVNHYAISLSNELGNLLDDKKLISDFENVIANGKWNDKPISENQAKFSKYFILHLLHTRYLFDRFFIKREYTGEDNEGEWSLKEIRTSGSANQKKAYYINTKLNYPREWERTYDYRNKECLMIQSALRVSYTSPKVMHWITALLCWLQENDEYPLLIEEAEKIAQESIKNSFLYNEDFKLGTDTPHIVFNYLDYLLWKENKTANYDFMFEFRNSVEHWYPQHPSDGDGFKPWEDKDTFGNLCIISRSVNSKFSNLSPKSKMTQFEKMVKRGSLKLRKMGEIMQTHTNQDWIQQECERHENEMLTILKNACENYT